MPISDLLAQISGEASSSNDAVVVRPQPVPPKRKAETELSQTNGKHAKTEQHAANTSRPITQAKPLISTTKVSQEVASRAGIRGGVEAARNGADSAKAAPPKKGSHAEIMARAKAGQMQFGQVGKIQHKPIEKGSSKLPPRAVQTSRISKATSGSSLSKSSKIGQVDTQKDKTKRQSDKGGYASTAQNGSKTKSSTKVTRLGMDKPVKKVKKAATATTGYTGTARPNTTLAKAKPGGGTSSTATPHRGYASGSNGRGSRGPMYSDEEEEEEEEDEEENYYSEASSDMEAAGFEVDEEEERALRIAKQEDIEEERRLKRVAEEKRKRLALMRGGGR